MSFAEDYTFDANCGDQVIPLSADYQDMVSFLHVDAAYRYCVSAVAPAYMVDTAKMDGSLVRHSSSACATQLPPPRQASFVIFSPMPSEREKP